MDFFVTYGKSIHCTKLCCVFNLSGFRTENVARVPFSEPYNVCLPYLSPICTACSTHLTFFYVTILWIVSTHSKLLKSVCNDFKRFSKIAKSDSFVMSICKLLISSVVYIWGEEYKVEEEKKLCLSVCPSVRMQQLGSHWTDLREIWSFRIFRKFCRWNLKGKNFPATSLNRLLGGQLG